MVYSYTQISQYLRCPRSYRYRYLDGWQEKETRAAMAFGRCFETALGAYFREEDCGATLFREWGAYRDTVFDYKKGETWDRLLHQGIHLLERFAQDNRVRIPDPHHNLQIKREFRLHSGSKSPERIPFLPGLILSERSSPSRVRCAAPQTGAPLTAPGHSEPRIRQEEKGLSGSCPTYAHSSLQEKVSLPRSSRQVTLGHLANLSLGFTH